MNLDNNSKRPNRKTVELKSKRLPLKKLLHGKEIREAAKALEEFRLHFTEQEILHGGKIFVKVGQFGEVECVVRRPETDSEYDARIEKARLAEIARLERAEARRIAAEKKRIKEEATKRERTADYIKKLAADAGLTVDILDK